MEEKKQKKTAEITEDDVFKILESYFQTYSISRYNIDSFNYFVDHDLKKMIQKHIRKLNRIKYEKQSNIKNRIFHVDNVQVLSPMWKDNKKLYPSTCRDHNLSYNGKIKVTLQIEEFEKINDTPNVITLKDVDFGELPIMVGSNRCNVTRLTGPEKARVNECLMDGGGYFILDGAEKVVMSEIVNKTNSIFVTQKEKLLNKERIKTFTSKIRSHFTLTDLDCEERASSSEVQITYHKQRSDVLKIKVLQNEIHLKYFIKFWNEKFTEEKHKLDLNVLTKHFEQYPSIQFLLKQVQAESKNNVEKFHRRSYGEFTKRFNDPIQIKVGRQHRQNIEVIERLVASMSGETKTEFKNVEQNRILLNMFNMFPLIHESSIDKIKFYIYTMIVSLFDVVVGNRRPDDREHYGNKRINTVGLLIRENYERSINESMTKLLQNQKSFYNINNKLFENHMNIKTLKTALKTGRWGAKNYTREGVAQSLERKGYLAVLSQLRRLLLPIDINDKDPTQKYIHPSIYGFVCPVESPEGGKVGKVLNYALLSRVSQYTSKRDLLETVQKALDEKEINLEPIGSEYYDNKVRHTLVALNGELIGSTTKPTGYESVIKQLRHTGEIDKDTSIVFHDEKKIIYIYCDSGRLLRPLFALDGEKNLVVKSQSKYDWKTLVKNNAIVYRDVLESSHSLILDRVERKRKDGMANMYDYSEIHPCTMMGILGNIIPFPEHLPTPRISYETSMGKQAIGLAYTNYFNRFDTTLRRLLYPQKPLVMTKVSRFFGLGEMPMGQNVMVAIMTFTGYNQEDSIIFNKSAIQRGLFWAETRKTVTIEFKKEYSVIGVGHGDFNKNPMINYNQLDSDGIIKRGSLVKKGDILCNMIDKKKNEDVSVFAQAKEIGIVEKISFIGRRNGVLSMIIQKDQKRGSERFDFFELFGESSVGGIELKSGFSKRYENLTMGNPVESNGRTVHLKIIRETTYIVIQVEKLETISTTVELKTDSKSVKIHIQSKSDKDYAKGVHIVIRKLNIPEIGDKFASRSAQKGVMGNFYNQEDMPWDGESGMTPDIIINPHAIPSRMTINQLIECLVGKASLLSGTILGDKPKHIAPKHIPFVNSSSFTTNPIYELESFYNEYVSIDEKSTLLFSKVWEVFQEVCSFKHTIPSHISSKDNLFHFFVDKLGKTDEQKSWVGYRIGNPKKIHSSLKVKNVVSVVSNFLKVHGFDENRNTQLYNPFTGKKYVNKQPKQIERLELNMTHSFIDFNLNYLKTKVFKNNYIYKVAETKGMYNIVVFQKQKQFTLEDLRLKLEKYLNDIGQQPFKLDVEHNDDSEINKTYKITYERLLYDKKVPNAEQFFKDADVKMSNKHDEESYQKIKEQLKGLSKKFDKKMSSKIEFDNTSQRLMLSIQTKYKSSMFDIKQHDIQFPEHWTYDKTIFNRENNTTQMVYIVNKTDTIHDDVFDLEEQLYQLSMEPYIGYKLNLHKEQSIVDNEDKRFNGLNVSNIPKNKFDSLSELENILPDSYTWNVQESNGVFVLKGDHVTLEHVHDVIHNWDQNITITKFRYKNVTKKPISVFMGPTFYQRLPHIVSEKAYGVSQSRKSEETRQPTDGRSKDGGLRFGEMERDAIIAHGMRQFLYERLFSSSDRYSINVCEICHQFYNIEKDNKNLTCTVCNTNKISTVNLPYISKTMIHYYTSMGIKTNIHVKQDQLYYDQNVDSKVTRPLRRFHNHVKRMLLVEYGGIDKSLLDLSCGRGGDLRKWFDGRYKRVIGVDIDSKGIEEAKKRRNNLLQHPQQDKNIKQWLNKSTIHFEVADSSYNLRETPSLDGILPKKYNTFDVVSCQFAIHYFFESREKLHGLLQNVSQNIKDRGVFIITTLDGNEVHRQLKDNPVIKETMEKDVIWKIEKMYPDNEKFSKFGQAINVTFHSLGSAKKEYLVPYTLLIEEAKLFGLDLIDTKSFVKIDKIKLINNRKLESFSNLNRYYVFRYDKTKDQMKDVKRPERLYKLTKYELLKILKHRVDQIHKIFDEAKDLDLHNDNLDSFYRENSIYVDDSIRSAQNPFEIALNEIKNYKLKYNVLRTLPNGRKLSIPLDKFKHIKLDLDFSKIPSLETYDSKKVDKYMKYLDKKIHRKREEKKRNESKWSWFHHCQHIDNKGNKCMKKKIENMNVKHVSTDGTLGKHKLAGRFCKDHFPVSSNIMNPSKYKLVQPLHPIRCFTCAKVVEYDLFKNNLIELKKKRQCADITDMDKKDILSSKAFQAHGLNICCVNIYLNIDTKSMFKDLSYSEQCVLP